MIFPNPPVRDVPAARAFWAELGFGFDEVFSDDRTACLVVEQNIRVMLVERGRFADFVTGEVADPHAPHAATSVLLCLSCASREEVDDLLGRALHTGAKPWRPVVDDGPMYGASFQDPDGHVWELVHMDLSGLPDAPSAG